MAASGSPIDESKLRHRWETPVFLVSAALNIALFIAAVWFVNNGAEWLKDYPMLAKRVEDLKGLAIAAVVAIPALPLVRNLRLAHVRGHSIRVGPQQFPEIHEIYRRQVSMLGMSTPPELYLAEHAEHAPARGYTAFKTSYIVLDTEDIDRHLPDSTDIIAFLIGCELGRLRLGQATWWDEVLLAYVVLVPILRRPLRRLRAYSRDRYGAALAPDGLRGLLVEASGRRALPNVNIPVYLEELHRHEGFWAKVSELVSEEPHVTNRVRALLDAGLMHPDSIPVPRHENEK